jgi:hypothetical protein
MYLVARFTDNQGGVDLPGRMSQPSRRLRRASEWTPKRARKMLVLSIPLGQRKTDWNVSAVGLLGVGGSTRVKGED